jgi:hypothetical protein
MPFSSFEESWRNLNGASISSSEMKLGEKKGVAGKIKR